MTQSQPTLAVRSSLGPWAPLWDQLVAALPVPSPFLRSWWLEAVAGPKRRFLLVADGSRLIGGLALEERDRGVASVVRMMGAGPLCPDHLDLISAPGHEGEVIGRLGAWLGRPGARFIDLQGVAAGALVRSALPHDVREDVIDLAPWAALPPDPEEFLAQRSANFRANIRKARRRLHLEGITHRVASPDSVETALARLRKLHFARWGESPFLRTFDRFAEASRAGASRGELAFHELVAGEAVIASVACFEVAGRVSLYQSGRSLDRRWRSAMTVLLHAIIEDACRRGVTEADFLRGNEPYKRSFASHERPILRLRAARGNAGEIAFATSLLWERTRRVASHLVRP